MCRHLVCLEHLPEHPVLQRLLHLVLVEDDGRQRGEALHAVHGAVEEAGASPARDRPGRGPGRGGPV